QSCPAVLAAIHVDAYSAWPGSARELRQTDHLSHGRSRQVRLCSVALALSLIVCLQESSACAHLQAWVPEFLTQVPLGRTRSAQCNGGPCRAVRKTGGPSH